MKLELSFVGQRTNTPVIADTAPIRHIVAYSSL